MPIPTTTTASNATVSASPVVVAGSIRERMNRRSRRQRINVSSTAAVAERAGSACGQARIAIPAPTPAAALMISRSRMTNTASGSAVRGGGADLGERRSHVRLNRQVAERHDPDRPVGFDDGQPSDLQVLHELEDPSNGVGGGHGGEIPAEDLFDGRGVRIPALSDGADRDIPVRDDARDALGLRLDHDHVPDVPIGHQARGGRQRGAEGHRFRLGRHDVADLGIVGKHPGGPRSIGPARDRVLQSPDRRATHLRSEGVAGAETHDVAEDAHDASSFVVLRIGCFLLPLDAASHAGSRAWRRRRRCSTYARLAPRVQGPREREAKFEVADDFDLPFLGQVAWRSSVKLSAHYWDTADQRLLRWGQTLRHRHASDGSEDGWTLKVGTPPGVRAAGVVLDRQELDEPGPPDEPAATIETEREKLLIGAVEVSDDRVSSSIDGIPGPSFRQIELEVRGPGAGRLLRDLSDRLIRAGAKPTTASKLE